MRAGSGAAYCGDDSLTTWSCDPCLASNLTLAKPGLTVVYDDKTTTRGFVSVMSDDSILVSFEGSETLMNWMMNADVAHSRRNMSCPKCEVHSGFYECWKSLHAPIVAFVQAELLARRHSTFTRREARDECRSAMKSTPRARRTFI